MNEHCLLELNLDDHALEMLLNNEDDTKFPTPKPLKNKHIISLYTKVNKLLSPTASRVDVWNTLMHKLCNEKIQNWLKIVQTVILVGEKNHSMKRKWEEELFKPREMRKQDASSRLKQQGIIDEESLKEIYEGKKKIDLDIEGVFDLFTLMAREFKINLADFVKWLLKNNSHLTTAMQKEMNHTNLSRQFDKIKKERKKGNKQYEMKGMKQLEKENVILQAELDMSLDETK